MKSFKSRHRPVAAVYLAFLLSCTGYSKAAEASYTSFEVPGAIGTYPMSISNSMAVTGYYYASPTLVRGFVRQPDGKFTTFDAVGSDWTEPEGINDVGEITGFYIAPEGGSVSTLVPHSFLRYPDGHIVTFDPPCVAVCNTSQAVAINAFGGIAGSFALSHDGAPGAFTRLRDGAFTIDYPQVSSDGDVEVAVATGINGSGTVVGYYLSTTGTHVDSFQVDARGYATGGMDAPAPGSDLPFTGYEYTIAEGMNAAGSVVGWYAGCNQPCSDTPIPGGFVYSPQGLFTLFAPPGAIVIIPRTGAGQNPAFFSALVTSAPHSLSINQSGSVAGSYTDAAGAQHGFLRNPHGAINSFDPPEGRQTTATSLNDHNVIAGTYLHNGNNPTVGGFIRVP